jgi:fibronectin type III domain protein
VLLAGCSNRQLDVGSVPPQPAPLVVESVSSNAVTLRWSIADSSAVAGYRMYRQGPADPTFRLAGATTIQRGAVSGLQTGTVYGFQVAAVNSEGVEGPRSETALARPALYAVAVNGSAEVTSNAAVSLQLSTGGFSQVRAAESLAALAQTNYQLVPGSLVLPLVFTGGDGVKVAYAQYRDGGSGAESAVVSDDIQLDRQAVISSVTQNAGAAPRSAGFTIHFTLTSGETDGVATVDIGSTRTSIRLYDDGTHGDATAGNGTYEVDYVVEATIDANDVPVTGRFTDRAGNIAVPVQAAGLVTISNPPPAVTLSDPLNQGGGKVLLLWEQSSVLDFQSYRVWHAPNSPAITSGQRILDTTITVRTAATVVVSGLAPGATRYFVVEVVDAAGNATPSNEKSIVVSAPNLLESEVAPLRGGDAISPTRTVRRSPRRGKRRLR